MVLRSAHIATLVLALMAISFTLVDPIPASHRKVIDKRVRKHFKPIAAHIDYEHRITDTTAAQFSFYLPIKDESDSLLSYLCYRTATACNFGGCRDTSGCDYGSEQFKEHIYYYAILTPGDTIEKMGILEYESTYGYEISSRWWLKQFKDRPSGSFQLGRNVDGLSGATVSVKAMIDDVNSLRSPAL